MSSAIGAAQTGDSRPGQHDCDTAEGAMSSTVARESTFGKRRAVRPGRPPRDMAGEVDARILDAARHVFLERGLAGASMDEIAALAGAGKPTIYARYPGKEALFTAVVMRNVDATVGRLKIDDALGRSVAERLSNLAATVLRWALANDTVGLMRLAISEARRFPELASSVSRMARGRASEVVAQLLSEVAGSGEPGGLPAFRPDQLPVTTRFFIDLMFTPLIMRALFGETLTVLEAEIEPHVGRGVAFFLAACRQGGVR
jgi:AcrR family transcriptional regulator